MRLNVAELLVAVLVIAMSVVFFVVSLGFPHMRADPGGGALWPQLMAAGAGGGSLILIAWRLWEAKAGNGLVEAAVNRLDRRTGAIILASIAYPFLILAIGFPIGTIAFIALLMRILKARLVEIAVFAPIFTAVLYLFFVYLLEAVVPHGALFDAIGG
ncbi:tripartite tricarboxylate transporter TctB family protein [Acuticoccus sp. M5D2P5]|uniref:tripartite tricarboxylate transporter TctB family protein n=1 Tax=Acuticoccus kalidii TaxID=2910977 RepID=UPI001F38B563|nr:tripartite tricarboxylate transporter TctB family protein [Acuticoccus kalidii]MCF3933394.1 tripartite tricarboxylate transporter TctB family protein [Acuticoccus kalidii]